MSCKKVAVVNRTNLKNYGSLLQSYALCEAVKMLGYECEIIWAKGNLSKNYDFRLKKIICTLFKLAFHPKLWKKTFALTKYTKETVIDEEKIKLFDAFVEENVDRKFYTYGNMKKAAKELYHKVICGSDQIWCSTSLYVDPLMYLRFCPKDKRIAYAPSIGRDYIPKYNARVMRKYINGIPCVSIREEKGQELIKELTGRDVPVVIDPTLLVGVEKWDTLKAESSQYDSKDYVLSYFLDEPDEQVQERIKQYATENNKKIVVLGSKLSKIDDELMECPSCGPKEFITIVANASYVMTDSYHGMLFSIMYGRQFAAIERYCLGFDQSSRQLSVLTMLKIPHRFIKSTEALPMDIIDYESVDEILKLNREKSKEYLRKSIEA